MIDALSIGAAVMIMTEVSKTLMAPRHAKRLGPYLAMAFSFAATLVWIVSAPAFPPSRLDIWPLFMGWLQVWATAVGVYHGAKLALAR